MPNSTATIERPAEAISPSQSCRSCGHQYRDHGSGAGCRHRDSDGDFCSCSLFQAIAPAGSRDIVAAAVAVARTKDQWTYFIDDGKPDLWVCDPPLPSPLGMDCPDHPTFPLIIKQGEAFCRRGLHFWEEPTGEHATSPKPPAERGS